VSWDANSLASLKKHYKDIDLLIPNNFMRSTPDGALDGRGLRTRAEHVKASPAEAISLLKDDKLHQWMKSLNPPIELPIWFVNNYDGVEWRGGHQRKWGSVACESRRRRNLIRDIVGIRGGIARGRHRRGFCRSARPEPGALPRFIGGLAPALHSVG